MSAFTHGATHEAHHTRTRSLLRGCNGLIRPSISQAFTRTTARAHWKNSSDMGAWNENDASACLLSMTIEPLQMRPHETFL